MRAHAAMMSSRGGRGEPFRAVRPISMSAAASVRTERGTPCIEPRRGGVALASLSVDIISDVERGVHLAGRCGVTVRRLQMQAPLSRQPHPSSNLAPRVIADTAGASYSEDGRWGVTLGGGASRSVGIAHRMRGRRSDRGASERRYLDRATSIRAGNMGRRPAPTSRSFRRDLSPPPYDSCSCSIGSRCEHRSRLVYS